MAEIIYIGLGSNLCDPQHQVLQAIDELDKIPKTQVICHSGLYQSSPMGPQDQGDYINAVAELQSSLKPLQLLDQLQTIELNHGRVRNAEQWGPRTLDLDLLLFGKQVISEERLVVPHYGLRDRGFVLIPLAEIAAELVLPDGTPINQLLQELTEQGITKL